MPKGVRTFLSGRPLPSTGAVPRGRHSAVPAARPPAAPCRGLATALLPSHLELTRGIMGPRGANCPHVNQQERSAGKALTHTPRGGPPGPSARRGTVAGSRTLARGPSGESLLSSGLMLLCNWTAHARAREQPPSACSWCRAVDLGSTRSLNTDSLHGNAGSRLPPVHLHLARRNGGTLRS